MECPLSCVSGAGGGKPGQVSRLVAVSPHTTAKHANHPAKVASAATPFWVKLWWCAWPPGATAPGRGGHGLCRPPTTLQPTFPTPDPAFPRPHVRHVRVSGCEGWVPGPSSHLPPRRNEFSWAVVAPGPVTAIRQRNYWARLNLCTGGIGGGSARIRPFVPNMVHWTPGPRNPGDPLPVSGRADHPPPATSPNLLSGVN